MLDTVAPEESEVADGIRIPCRCIYALLEKLEELVKPDADDPYGERYISDQCSISCSAAILALQSLCRRKVCANCLHQANCSAEICDVKPGQVLFHSED